jgi:hypothetical protein
MSGNAQAPSTGCVILEVSDLDSSSTSTSPLPDPEKPGLRLRSTLRRRICWVLSYPVGRSVAPVGRRCGNAPSRPNLSNPYTTRTMPVVVSPSGDNSTHQAYSCAS